MHACKQTYIDIYGYETVASRLNLTSVAVKIRPKLDKNHLEESFLNPPLSFLKILPPPSPRINIDIKINDKKIAKFELNQNQKQYSKRKKNFKKSVYQDGNKCD